MAYAVVQKCPLTFLDWSDQASSTCNRDTYHCVADEKSKIVEVCTTPLWIEAGHCPVYNTVTKKIDSIVCAGENCPQEVYRSDAVYKYNGCQLFASRTTSTSPLASTPLTSTYKTDTSNTSTIAGSVIPVLVIILLVVLGILFWKKKGEFVSQYCCLCREQMKSTIDTCESEKLIDDEPDFAVLEKNTPKELDVNKELISEWEKYLETSQNMIAMFGKLGTGKRTLASQIAIRLAKKEPTSKIRLVEERDLISKELDFKHSTILIILDPVKACYTVSHVEYIIKCLLKICEEIQNTRSYILVIFHHDDLDLIYRRFGNMKKAFESKFTKVLRICNDNKTLTEIAKSNNGEISYENIGKIQQRGSSVGELVLLTLWEKNSEFQTEQFLSNPIKFIISSLETLERSDDIRNQITFKLLVYIVLHGGKIAKCRSKDIPHHALFDDLREKMDKEKTIIKTCIDKLLDLYIEESADGRSYRVVHDVISKCTVMSAFQNNMPLLFKECDLIVLFDCIRLKGRTEKITKSKQTVYDFENLKIAIPTEFFPAIARLSFERKEIIDIFKSIILFEDEELQKEWNKWHALCLKKEKGEVKHNIAT